MEMKGKVATKYMRRVCKVLESKLNGGNGIKGINTWAVFYQETFLCSFFCFLASATVSQHGLIKSLSTALTATSKYSVDSFT